MVNTSKIKSRMVLCGITQSSLAEKLKLSQTTVNQKINNARKTTIEEALLIKKHLDISDCEFGEYFFV